MKKVLVLVLSLALIFVLTGCFKHSFTVGKGAPGGKVVYKEWHSHWLYGIIGEKNVELDKLCPSGNATIHEKTSFVNGLIGALIGIIYYPTTVTIECAEGGRTEIELSTEQMAQIATDPSFLAFVEEVAPERMDDALVAMDNAQLMLK